MFQVHSLKARRGTRLVFRDVSFDLAASDLVLITGANGSGKSSLLRVLAGLVQPISGTMLWHNVPVADDEDAHRQRLHYVGHLDALKPELTVGETLTYWHTLFHMRPLSSNPLDVFDLAALADRPVRYLSAGQRRRLALTRLVLHEAPLWLLDEPTTALDQKGQLILQRLIEMHRAKGGMALIATHHAIDIPHTAVLHLT